VSDVDPLVSVIVPVYQRAHCVMDAVDSVLGQTHTRVECVVVDDGSSDGGAEAVAAACRDEPRVLVVRQTHGGQSSARNHGLRRASGRFVTFLDSDDVMPANRIGRQLELLAEHDTDAVLGSMAVVPTGAPIPAWLRARPEWQTGYHWMTILLATHHLRAIGGFDEDLRVDVDSDLLVRLRVAGVRITAVDDTFVHVRYFGDNLTYDNPARRQPFGDAIRRELARRRAASMS
jgi:glycosyltransferase involved in cell wall biosynthesis